MVLHLTGLKQTNNQTNAASITTTGAEAVYYAHCYCCCQTDEDEMPSLDQMQTRIQLCPISCCLAYHFVIPRIWLSDPSRPVLTLVTTG